MADPSTTPPAEPAPGQTGAGASADLGPEPEAAAAEESEAVAVPVVDNTVLSAESLEAASALKVVGADGKEVELGSVHGQRVVLIALRHLQCPLDQNYVTHICEALTPARLEAANARVVFLTPGAASLIETYSKAVKATSPIYSASQEVYHALGMTLRTNERADERASYQRGSFLKQLGNALGRTFKRSSSSPRDAGDPLQVGGEFIFKDGVNDRAYRMRHINDHRIREDWPEPDAAAPEAVKRAPNVIHAPLMPLDESATLPTTKSAAAAALAAEEAERQALIEAKAVQEAEEAAEKARRQAEIAAKVIPTPTAKMLDTPVPAAVVRSVAAGPMPDDANIAV